MPIEYTKQTTGTKAPVYASLSGETFQKSRRRNHQWKKKRPLHEALGHELGRQRQEQSLANENSSIKRQNEGRMRRMRIIGLFENPVFHVFIVVSQEESKHTRQKYHRFSHRGTKKHKAKKKTKEIKLWSRRSLKSGNDKKKQVTR